MNVLPSNGVLIMILLQSKDKILKRVGLVTFLGFPTFSVLHPDLYFISSYILHNIPLPIPQSWGSQSVRMDMVPEQHHSLP